MLTHPIPLAVALLLHAHPHDPARVEIPAGAAPVVDGRIAPGEWDDAGHAFLEVRPAWRVEVRFKHDAEHLYFAFTGLKQGGEERYPEVLVGLAGTPAETWQPTDHWIHASYQNCDASGRPNGYEGCAASRAGWNANTFPLEEPGVVEMRVSFTRVGLSPGAADLRVAFVVTDTRREWILWPGGASMESPRGWAVAASPTAWAALAPRDGENLSGG